MRSIQGEEKPVNLRMKVIGVAAVLAVGVLVAVGVTTAAHAAQVKAEAQHAMAVAAPAYQGTIELGGTLDDLNVQSVQAKADYDAEQARLAAEKAAQEAAAAAAAQVAAQAAAQQAAAEAAADEAARQAAAEDSSSDEASGDSAPAPSAGGGLPAGSPVPSPNGYYDTTLCASGSASTVNGVPTCD